ncbi:cilia- and flagella-associated protein 69 isoform X2 [Megachile rotundata]|uniref:cilia- and flagella-associated protein 69 isoform X2 n=1 Tax=Megachile rotundata TaxID=143995 RepID=UPI003FD2980B
MERNELDIQDFDKLKVSNICKEFNCLPCISEIDTKADKIPKVLFNFNNPLKIDVNYILSKLHELISDPITNISVLRICRLLHDYLCYAGTDGYKIKDLPIVIKLLKFLAQNVKLVKDYELYLDQMLELCSLPPLLEKSSEGFFKNDIMEQYFTLLGQLFIILPIQEQALKVHKALHSLLMKQRLKNAATIKLELCYRAVERSKLPIIVTELLQSSSPDTYPKFLELVFLLSSISCTCSHKMLEAGVLKTILARMDLPYATQLHCTRPPDSLLIGNEYSEETTDLIMNTLWGLMKSVISPNEVPINLKNILTSAHCGLWGLCYSFERQVCYSQCRKSRIRIRNEIAVIILVILITFPSWNIVSSGIADDVIKFFNGVEAGSVRVFSQNVKFGRSNEDLFFQKVLLLIITHLAEIDACIFLMEDRKLMRTVLHLVNPNVEECKITWNPSQFWDLWTYAINALSVLVPKMPREFIKHHGTARLFIILEWCLSTKFNMKIVLNWTKTVCTIILNNNVILLENFREHGITLLLIKLINRILDFKKITMKHQRILTLVLISIEKLLKKQTFYQEMYGEQNIALTMELFFRCLYHKDNELQINQCLLLAIGSYVWECIVQCPKNLKKFVKYGAVYIILDILDIAPYPSQCVFLGILTDMCDNYFCGPYLCTWRGIDKRTGLMSLAAKIWREEEIRVKVKRHADGSVLDVELPQMGNKQWSETYCTKLMQNVSPAIVDMIGSVRSKIYSIRRIIERDRERYQFAKERYNVFCVDLSMEDRITIFSIDLYFKIKVGQIWVEISKYFEQVGITPLGMDGQALFLMTQRYYSWGKLIKDREQTIIKSIKTKEDIEEKDEYTRIRESKLILALDAFDELDYIYRTTNRLYLLEKKDKQIQQVNAALNFPLDSDDAHCHRTFSDKPTVTAIFNQHPVIKSSLMPDSNFNQVKLLPVSSCHSFISDNAYSSEISLPIASSTCVLKPKEFVTDM